MPGLPSILWFDQTFKGILILIVDIALMIFFWPLALITVVVGSIDAYRIATRIDEGQHIGKWTFF